MPPWVFWHAVEIVGREDSLGPGHLEAGEWLPGQRGSTGTGRNGLARAGTEVKAMCRVLGIEDATQVNTTIGKEEVNEAINLNHLKYLKETMRGEKLKIISQTYLRACCPLVA